MADRLYFGPFECRPGERLLLDAGKPVPLGGRAFDILLVLLEQAGNIVCKHELIACVWPGLTVGEGALRVHMSALRRTLKEDQSGHRYICNVAGRGYIFVALLHQGNDVGMSTATLPPQFAFPVLQPRIFGREEAVQTLTSKLAGSRLVTLVGPGGVGKTTIALYAAGLLQKTYPSGTVFVDVAAIDEPKNLVGALATALGVASREEQVVPVLLSYLYNKQMLIVLDSCERIIEAAATLAETLVSGTSDLRILATSREPLRAQGETVQRIGPLALPPLAAKNSADQTLDYASVKLFVERAKAAEESFELNDSNASTVASICHRLDGMPLAIELVAARVYAIGLHGLSSLLDDRLRLLTSLGRRTAQKRHRTLQAALDWSYELLSPVERAILQRLSVFSGFIDLNAAHAVASEPEASPNDFIEGMANLISKSLVAADIDGDAIKYRLLDTTRYYAHEKLSQTGNSADVSLRHANYFIKLFKTATEQAEVMPVDCWITIYGSQLANVRAALDWAFSPDGDQAVGVELTIYSIQLWMRLLLLRECRIRLERALAVPLEARTAYANMRLFAGLGGISGHADSTNPDVIGAWWEVLQLSEQLDEPQYQTRALWGLWVELLQVGQFRNALEIARKFQTVAQNMADPSIALVADRQAGYTLHFLGDQLGARSLIEHLLAHYPEASRVQDRFRFQFDQPVTARITMAWILWLQGFPDQALECTKQNVEDALRLDHPLSLGNALAKSACAIALLTGDMTLAQSLVTLFAEQTRPNAVAIWQPLSRCYEGLLSITRGNTAKGLDTVLTTLKQSHLGRFTFPYSWVLGEIALAQAKCGKISAGRNTIHKAIADAQRDEERWCLPELLRVRGVIAMQDGDLNAKSQAESDFMQALELARDQQVLSWELRSATSLAHLWQENGREAAAAELLGSVYERFNEGFKTADLVTARLLLAKLT